MSRAVRFKVLPAIIVAVLVFGLPACTPDLCGSGVPLSTRVAVATERATSCAFTVNIEGRQYVPWCTPVQTGLISDAAQFSGREGYERYEARLIKGVPQEEAVALAFIMTNPSGDQRRAEGRCGYFRFAPTTELSTEDAKALARRVGIPGKLNLA